MEQYMHKVGLYFSIAWMLYMIYELGIQLLVDFGFHPIVGTTNSSFDPFLINLIYGLLAIVVLMITASVLYAVPKRLKKPWGALLAGVLLDGLVQWAYDRGFGWIVIGASGRFLGLILTIYAVWEFKKYQFVQNR